MLTKLFAFSLQLQLEGYLLPFEIDFETVAYGFNGPSLSNSSD